MKQTPFVRYGLEVLRVIETFDANVFELYRELGLDVELAVKLSPPRKPRRLVKKMTGPISR